LLLFIFADENSQYDMKFIVSSSALLKQLQNVGGVLNSSNTLPILDNFLFDIKDKVLTISASDLESTMVTSMPIESKEDGRIAVPARLIMDTLKNFPEQPLTFNVDEKTFGMEISSENGKFKLSGFNADEYPRIPELESPATVNVSSEIVSEAVNRTLFATGSDDLRPVMSGVFFEFGTDHLRFVATDAHKLVRYSRTDVQASSNATFIVPKKPLNLLKGLLGATNSDVNIEYNEANVRFTFDDMTLVSRLIDGKYPNYQAVIPEVNPNRMTIARHSLLSSIKRVSIFSNKTTHQVRLKIAGSELTVSAEDLDFANEANERLTCAYEGEDMEIGFNSKFIIDMLNNLDSDNIVLEMSAPNRAGIMVPAENDEAGEDILMLVMPVMLNS
jgi:DNA polymerase-3 subunit beta